MDWFLYDKDLCHETVNDNFHIHTVQKMKFFINNFLSKCKQIRRKLWISSHLLKKPLIENFIFCAVSAHVRRYTDQTKARVLVYSTFWTWSNRIILYT